MSFLNDYYLFHKDSEKGKTRMGCIASTGSYPVFEDMRKTEDRKETKNSGEIKRGDLILYLCDASKNDNLECKPERKPIFTIKGEKHISGVYIPNLKDYATTGFGDVKGTSDAIIFKLNIEMVNGGIKPGGTLEIFVARGMGKDKFALYNLACEGELDYEMEMLRAQASNKAYDKERI